MLDVYKIVHTSYWPIIENTATGDTYNIYEAIQLLNEYDNSILEIGNKLQKTNDQLKEINKRLEGLNGCW